MQADEEQHWSSVDNRKLQQVPGFPRVSLLVKVGNYPGTHWQARQIFLEDEDGCVSVGSTKVSVKETLGVALELDPKIRSSMKHFGAHFTKTTGVEFLWYVGSCVIQDKSRIIMHVKTHDSLCDLFVFCK